MRNTSGESPVDLKAAALLTSAIVPSSIVGVAINRVVPGAVVKITFALLLLALAYPTAARAWDRTLERSEIHSRHSSLTFSLSQGV